MCGCESWTIEKAPKNWCFCTVVLEKTLESSLDIKEIKPVNPKGNQSWIFIGRIDAEAETPTLATWCEELSYLKRPWCWERLKAGGEGDHRGWDGRMASLTQWTWVWVNFGSWWWTGRPGMLQSMGFQRFRRDWATELNWTDWLSPVTQKVKNLPAVWETRFDPWVGESSGKGNGNLLQFSCLENPIDRGA